MSNQQEQVFYSPSQKYNGAIDYFKAGASFSVYAKKLRSELVEEYPDGIMISWEEAAKMTDGRATTGPKEIDAERFWYLLEVLPPAMWCNYGSTQSFRVPECITGTVYTAAVQIGDKYFELQQPRSVTHDQLVAMCRAVMP